MGCRSRFPRQTPHSTINFAQPLTFLPASRANIRTDANASGQQLMEVSTDQKWEAHLK